MSLAALALALTLALTLTGGTARADDRDDARREFAAGQEADRRRDWRAAIEHYLRANDLVPHPFAVYNIAVNYERLDQLREAATWYRRYLATATDAGDRERVQRALSDLETRPSPFSVRSAPPGARVRVDGVPVGTTPFTGALRVGFHRVVVELDGRRELRDVTAGYGEPVALEVTLPAAIGMIRVTGAPLGAAVEIDGAPAGRMPARLSVMAGRRVVRVSAAGYQTYETTVEVMPSREHAVEARLPPGTGMTTTATPPLGRIVPVGYVVGAGGGVDARGSGALGALEVGFRVNRFDSTLRVGKLAGMSAIDVQFRWALTPGRIAPFVGGGYTFIDGGAGGIAAAGLRWDVTIGPRATFSLLLESGLRAYTAAADVDAGEAERSVTGVVVPLQTSLLLTYR